MNTKRGRPEIKPHLKRLIYTKALESKAPRQSLAVELKNLIEDMGEIPPSEETMMRHISSARNYPASPLDELWTLKSLENNPIPPEALPLILEVWRNDIINTLTIRHVKWVSRLFVLFKEDIDKLTQVARFYANEELVNEVSGMSEYEFDGTKGIMSLYEWWKGRIPQDQRSRLLLKPILHSDDPKVQTMAKFWREGAEIQGELLRERKERRIGQKDSLNGGN